MTSASSYSPPPAFGRFRVLHQIGAGVLGPVFRTHDPDHDCLVAVKAFSLDLTPEQAVHLSAQIQTLVDLDLDHPCLAAPVATGVEDFVPYLAAPYVAGESLDAAIRQYGPAPAGDAIRLIAHVAEALDAAAHVGVFHGSLHPRDILVTPGETHVTGLGIAQALERVGQHGPIRRPYVAPEREGGDEWGAAADVYSLGAIAYEVLTGRRALPGTDQPLPGLADLKVHDAAALRDSLEAALDPDPERRPGSAQEFAAAFAAALSETAGPAPPERGHGHRPRKPRSRPVKLPGLNEPLTAVVPAAEAASAGTPATREMAGALATPSKAPDSALIPEAPPEPTPETPPDVPAITAPEPEVVVAQTVPPPPEVTPADPNGPAIAVDALLLATPVTLGQFELPAATLSTVDLPAPAEDTGAAGLDIAFDLGTPTPAAINLRDELGPVGGGEATPTPGSLLESGTFPLDFADLDKVGSSSSAARATPDLDRFDFAFAPEPPDDFRVAEPTPAVPPLAPDEPPFRPAIRRRTPPRTSARPAPVGSDAPPPDREVPRAFEPAAEARPSAILRDFEPGGPPLSRWPSALRMIGGVALGLALGLATGYWLGSRASVPAPAAQAAPSRAPARPAGVQPAPPTSASSAPAPAAAPRSAAPGPAGVQLTTAPPVRPAASTPSVSPIPVTASPAAAAAGAKPIAAVPSGRGTIAVAATPLAANVYIDGTPDGLTPRNLKGVPFGTHTIRVTRPGYVPEEKTVVLGASEPSVRVEFRLRPGNAVRPPAAAAKPVPEVPKPVPAGSETLVIETRPPGARARVDGRDAGVTPVTLTSIKAGLHKIELQLSGYRRWAETITVKAGQRRLVAISLERTTQR